MTIFQPGSRGSHHDARRDGNQQETQSSEPECSEVATGIDEPGIEFARCFLGLADLDKGAFERLGRYETALCRQVRQTIFTLQYLQCDRPTDDFGKSRIGGNEPFSRLSTVSNNVGVNPALDRIPDCAQTAPSLATITNSRSNHEIHPWKLGHCKLVD